MIRKLIFSALLSIALLLMAACGGGSAPASSGDTGSSGDVPAAPASSGANTGAAPPPAARPTPAPASTEAPPENVTREIKDISGRLDTLKSYRLLFTFSFEGKDEQGKSQNGSIEILQEVIKESNDQHMRMTGSGDTAQGDVFEFFQVGGTSYIYSSEGQDKKQCVGFSSDSASGAMPGEMFTPSDIVGGIDKANLVKRGETVNGVVTDHYTFDEGGVSFGSFTNASGDVWVAQDGEFLVKYLGKATGKSDLMGQKAEGTFTWEYNINDINKVEAIELPKECENQQQADDIPLPDNATEKGRFGGISTFKSPDAPADVAAFFKKELPAQGWAAGEESALGDLVTLKFTKDDRELSITITKDEKGGTSVLITENKQS